MILGLLGWLLSLGWCVDALLWKEQPPPSPTASVPPSGPWAGGPPIYWGRPGIKLINDSTEPVFVESLSILGMSMLDRHEERSRHLLTDDYPSTLWAAFPIPAGSFTVSVQVRLEQSGRVLAADLPSWVHAEYRCYMDITIGAHGLQAAPCITTSRVDSDEFYD